MKFNRNQFIGIFFIFLGIFNFIVSYQEGSPEGILWICSATIFLFAFGVLNGNNLAISSAITASFLFNLIWTIDYIGFLLVGKLPIGIAVYLLTSEKLRIIATSYHFFMLIIPLLIIFKNKEYPQFSWIGASTFLLIISIISLFTKNWLNINCVHESCELGIFSFLEPIKNILLTILPLFIIQWGFMTLVVFIPTHIFFRKITAWINN